MKTLFLLSAISLSFTLVSIPVAANPIYFSGGLVPSTCEVNDIDVDFGTQVTTDVAAGRVERTVNYTINCGSSDPNKPLKVRISGTGAGFDSQALKTSISSLGVMIKANGVKYPLNSDLKFSSAVSKPALTAQLVQQSGARLPTGGFTATATMTVDYQ